MQVLLFAHKSEISAALRHPGIGGTVQNLEDSFPLQGPHLGLEARLQLVMR